MAIDMEEIGVIADASDDVLVPDLGQQGPAARFQKHILPFDVRGHGFHHRLPLDAASHSRASFEPDLGRYPSITACSSARAREDGSHAGSLRPSRARWQARRRRGYFSMSAKVFAKVCASPGHRAET